MSAVRVLFDTQAFRFQRLGGVSRYFAQLIRTLRLFNVSPILRMPFTANEHAASAGLSRLISSDFVRRVANRSLAYSDSIVTRAARFDVLHRTYFGIPQGTRRPSVCTVHDMTPELFPGHFRENPHRHKHEVVWASDLVLCVSESTTRDLLDIYDYPSARVFTTPLGIDLAFFENTPVAPNPFRRPYLLFVGDRGGYKNFERFSVAAAELLSRHRGLSLAVLGGPPLSTGELDPFRKVGVLERVSRASVGDSTLPTVYREAEAFVFPSEYEGFGLPLLEAFACRCPVAASRTSSLGEIGGAAVEYFDPRSIDDMARAMTTILESPTRALQLKQRGLDQVRLYSWERTAAATAAAYRWLL